MEWTNRLILGDSPVVINSLAKREDLAGKVQMIYMDPPYGIRFSANFQPLITGSFPYFKTQDDSNQLHAKSFIYETAPHITLRSIAQNLALNPIFAKWEPILKGKLEMLNRTHHKVSPYRASTVFTS